MSRNRPQFDTRIAEATGNSYAFDFLDKLRNGVPMATALTAAAADIATDVLDARAHYDSDPHADATAEISIFVVTILEGIQLLRKGGVKV